MHAWFTEEQSAAQDPGAYSRARVLGRFAVEKPPLVPQEIGPIGGAAPKVHVREHGVPSLSLESRDVDGASCMPKVGNLRASVCAPMGNRPEHPRTLVTHDIEGAQADTLTRFPKCHRKQAQAWGAVVVGIPNKMDATLTPRAKPTASGRCGGGGLYEPLGINEALPAERGK